MTFSYRERYVTVSPTIDSSAKGRPYYIDYDIIDKVSGTRIFHKVLKVCKDCKSANTHATKLAKKLKAQLFLADTLSFVDTYIVPMKDRIMC